VFGHDPKWERLRKRRTKNLVTGVNSESVVEEQVFENEELPKTDLGTLGGHPMSFVGQCSIRMATWSACYHASDGIWNENLERTLLCS